MVVTIFWVQKLIVSLNKWSAKSMVWLVKQKDQNNNCYEVGKKTVAKDYILKRYKFKAKSSV